MSMHKILLITFFYQIISLVIRPTHIEVEFGDTPFTGRRLIDWPGISIGGPCYGVPFF